MTRTIIFHLQVMGKLMRHKEQVLRQSVSQSVSQSVLPP